MISELAALLDEAARTASTVPGRVDRPWLDLEAAYEVQAASIALREARGERLAGVKMGFTSEAKMRQMGVSEVIWGRLTDAMRVPDGGSLALSPYIHPRAEPEVAFRLAAAPAPGMPLSELVDAVAPAIEVIDSRYEDFKFTVPEVVADNASSAAFAVGPWQRFTPDLVGLDVSLTVDGTPVETGSTSAILGDPLKALEAAIALTARHRVPLKAGDVILAGAATAAVALKPGSVIRATVAGLGSVSFGTTP